MKNSWLPNLATKLFQHISNMKLSEVADPKVIILICVHKENLDPYEIISMKQCFKILGHYPIKIVCPKGMNIDQYLNINPKASFDFIPSYWQSSYKNMEAMRILPFIYKRYIEYDYLLIYELDAFVFRDELMEWCRKGYDYIGAPWLEGWREAKPNAPFIGVGNGGFSLRKTRSLIKAVNSFSYIEKPVELWERLQNAPPARKPYLFFDMIEKLTIRNNTHLLFNDWIGFRGEDIFWGTVVNPNFKWFTVPEPEEALRFSFEVQPQYLYELNHLHLPFGCHKWWEYNLEFWRPFICEFGYEV